MTSLDVKQNTNSNRVLFKNITAFSFLQLMNYAFPLLTIPYVVRVLGVEKFGLVSFVAAFVNYFTLLTDFGFNFSATRSISINRDNPNRITEILFSVYTIKAILFILSSILFLLTILFVPVLNSEKELCLVSYLSVLGTMLLPQWYFQGVGKMSVITWVTFCVRITTVILIFVLVHTVTDYKVYAFLNSAGGVLIGFLTFLFVIKNLRKNQPFNGTTFFSVLKEGSVMFISNASINLYTSSNTFILGLFASPTIVGYWAAADKIRIAIQGILSPITQGFYPHLAHLFSQSREKAIEFIKKSFLPIGIIGFIVSLSLLLFAEPISLLLLGKEFVNSLILVKIISFLPFVILLSNFFGIQILLNLNGSREFSFTVFIAGIFNLILSFIMVPKLLAIGTAISVLMTEVIVTLLMIYFAQRRLRIEGNNEI